MGFYGPLVKPIRIENFEKPYNNTGYLMKYIDSVLGLGQN
jgi:hypothetical protein